jgi:hypothetical protein
MSVDRCRIVERSEPLFGLGARVALQSPLDAPGGWARLRGTFPKFNVPPEYPTIAGPRPRIYFGSIQDDTFRLNSARRIGRQRPAWLHVRGTITPHGNGSLIRFGVYAPGVILCKLLVGMMALVVVAFGIWWIVGTIGAARDGIGLLMSLVILLIFAGPLLVVPCVAVAWNLSAAQRETTFLLDYLQQLFDAQSEQSRPTMRMRDDRAGAAEAEFELSPVAVAAARAERRVFTGSMRAVGLIGGGLALMFGLVVLLIFVVPAWQDYRLLQRMVEARCTVLDSRLTEEQYPETQPMKRGRKTEQVPTGRMLSRFKPEFFIRYEVAGTSIEKWAYASHRFAGFRERGPAEQAMQQFARGQQYACWYDPQDPHTVVLDKSNAVAGVFTMVVLAVVAFAGVAALPVMLAVLAFGAIRANPRTTTDFQSVQL